MIINWRTEALQLSLYNAAWNVFLKILEHWNFHVRNFYIIFRTRTLDSTWLITYALQRYTHTHTLARTPFMLVHENVMYCNSEWMIYHMGLPLLYQLNLAFWVAVLFYLAGCKTFLHIPAPIWQLYFLLLRFVSVIPVFFH